MQRRSLRAGFSFIAGISTVFMGCWLSIRLASSKGRVLGLWRHRILRPSPQGRSFSRWRRVFFEERFRISSSVLVLSSRSAWRFALTSVFEVLCVGVIALILPASKLRHSWSLMGHFVSSEKVTPRKSYESRLLYGSGRRLTPSPPPGFGARTDAFNNRRKKKKRCGQ